MPPGPWALPFLGSAYVIWALLRKTPLPDILVKLRAKYGPLFMIKAGPSKQVWVSDPKLLRQIYELPGCSGRPAGFADPFGNFLFLVKEPGAAAPLREQQEAWLDTNLDQGKVCSIVEHSFSKLWATLDEAGPQPWHRDLVRTVIYDSVTHTFLGDQGRVTDGELQEFLEATQAYSEMRVKRKFGKGKEAEAPPGAEQIRRILKGAMDRGNVADPDVAFPLIVAASVGGAQIFPTLLHWLVLGYAADHELQERTAQAAIDGQEAVVLELVYTLLRRTPYSVALGPPRKVLADSEVEGMRVPEGALLFAMHPALADQARGHKPTEKDGQEFSEYAFGHGLRSCLGRNLMEAVLPAAVGALLKRYTVRFAELEVGQDPLRGEARGQLIHPVGAPLLWSQRQGDPESQTTTPEAET